MRKKQNVKAHDLSSQRTLKVSKLLSVFMLGVFLCIFTTATPNENLQTPTKEVSGVVTDNTGEPVAGVIVLVKGTMVATTTNGAGAFMLGIPEGAQALTFSYMGFKTVETSIGTRTVFNIEMEPENVEIEGLVVIGYGSLSKKDMSTSVGSLRADDLEDRASAFNIMQSVGGKVAGVKNVSFSGKPGGSSALRIRGMGSVNAGKDPIYVLDGVIGVDPNIINSSNIESIDILKDAAATAMYGAQGANGVVIITTKKGKQGSGIITYDGRIGVGFLNREIDVLNADEFMEVQKRAYGYSGQTMPHLTNPMEKLFYYAKDASGNYMRDNSGNLIASPKYDTDWQKALTQRAITNDQILSFSSANDKTSIYASAAYQDFQGLVRETYSNRLTGTINVNSKINNWFKIQAMGTMGTQEGNEMDGGFGQGPVRNMIEMLPIVPMNYEDGTWGRKNDYPLGESAENPLRLLQEQKKEWKSNFFVFNLTGTIDITKKLQFTAQAGLQMSNRNGMEYAKAGLLDVSENNGGYADLNNNVTRKMSSENYFTYTDRFFDDKLNSSFVLGASWYNNYAESFSSGSEQFFDDSFGYHNLGAGTTFHKPNSGIPVDNRMNSYYFRMNHSFKERYLLGFTLRADGASNFGKNNKYGFFPSVSAAWRISEEDFFEPVKDVVNNVKLRFSWGVVGNATIPDYRTISSYNNNTMIMNKQLNSYVVLGNLGNPDLKWESSEQFNVGLDISFLKNRFELIVDIYKKPTRDLLFEKQLPITTGYYSAWTNLGEIVNKGLEATVSSRNINSGNFLWTSDLVFSTNKLVVVDVGGETIDTGNNTIAKVGEEWASYYLFNRLGTWGLDEVGEAVKYGKKPGDIKYEDVNGDYVIDDSDRKIMGNGLPKGDLSFVNTLRYKGLTLMMDLNYSYGAKIMGITTTMMENRQLYGNSVSSVLNAWAPENQNSMIAALRLASDVNFGENEKDSHMLFNGDFLRIRNIALSYDFNPKLLRGLKVIKQLSLGVAVENLHVFSDYPGYDPEVGAFSTDTGQGIDFYSYPRPTTVSANLKIVF